ITINKLSTRIQLHGIKIDVSKTALEFLAEKGFDQNYGARPLRRAIQKYLEDPLSEEILKGNFKGGGKVKVKYKKGNDELTFVDDKKDTGDKESVEELEETKENLDT
ncbi:MAG: ATP-dependent Clp protease ATP-binding subunit, partial [bacterium]